MDNLNELMMGIERALAGGFRARYQAGATGKSLFLLLRSRAMDEQPVQLLLERFWDCIASRGWADLLEHQQHYAIRVASASSDLLQEEIHKLFSLADEIHALRDLGFRTTVDLDRRFESSLRQRFRRQPVEARQAAEANVEDWSRPLWWYAETLPH